MAIHWMRFNMNKQDLDDLLFYAFRYALGRATYAVNDVIHYLMKYEDDLSDATKRLIIRDIKREKQLGMPQDKLMWINLIERWSE